jgi:RHS repeat-associated protein
LRERGVSPWRRTFRIGIAEAREVGAIEANCTDSIDNDADGTVNDGCARYILADHLGSTSTIVDRNGATATVKYRPYGATRSTSGAVGTDKLFTGQQQEPDDPALGLYNYGARFYSTTLGRFVSADPVRSMA